MPFRFSASILAVLCCATATLSAIAQVSFAPPVSYDTVDQPLVFQSVDFDRDGKVDLLIADKVGDLWFYRGEGNGTFQTAKKITPQKLLNVPFRVTKITVADFNNDQLPDLAVAGYWAFNQQYSPITYEVGILVNGGNGTIAALNSVQVSDANCKPTDRMADLDHDGKLDLLITQEYGKHPFLMFRGTGDGSIQPSGIDILPTNSGYVVRSVVDMNGDGNVDLVVDGPEGHAVLYGDGLTVRFPGVNSATGQLFDPQVVGITGYLFVQDVNSDNLPDVITYDFGQITTRLNLGGGRFAAPILSNASLSGPQGDFDRTFFGDFDGDGATDMALSSTRFGYGTFTLYIGNNDGSFQAAVPAAIDAGLAFVADFNADNKTDVVTQTTLERSFSVMLNRSVVIGAVAITLNSTIPGLALQADGKNYVTPVNFNWRPGSAHLVRFTTPQYLGVGTRAAFDAWTDGFSTPYRTITVPNDGATYTAKFKRQFLLTLTHVGYGGIDATLATGGYSDNGYWDEGSDLRVDAHANEAYLGLIRIDGDIVSTTAPIYFTITKPMALNAIFGYVGLTNYNSYRFIPIPPCRAIDTRIPPRRAFKANEAMTLNVNAGDCQLPSAGAYAVNITVVPLGGLPYLTVWFAGDQPQPLASLLNSLDGRIKANSTIVGSSYGGTEMNVYAAAPTHVIVDVYGYFVPKNDATALDYYVVGPCRVYDSRNAAGALGGPSLVANQARTIPVSNANCGIPYTAKAYSFNVTAVPKRSLGFVTVWPTGQPKPWVSTLNAPTGTIVANGAIVPAGANGSVDVFASDDTDLVIDINGYFAPPNGAGLAFSWKQTCRVFDTRTDVFAPALTGPRNFYLESGSCGSVQGARAILGNFTVVPKNQLGYLTSWAGGTARPLASTLNALDGAITSNTTLVPVYNSTIGVFTDQTADVIFDISGYFSPSN